MSRSVAGSRDRRDLRIPEFHDVAVGERDVLELDAGVRGQIGSRTRARHELRQTGHVVGLDVRLEHGDDRDALRRGERDVVVDEVRV